MMTRTWKRNWIVIVALIVHGGWGLILLFDASPLHTTPLGHLPFRNHVAAAIALLAASVCAAIPVCYRKWDHGVAGLLLTLPQQWLLMSSVFTAIISLIRGAYPDGYVPDRWGNPHLFIFVDQLWPIIGMLCHTLSLFDWFWWSRKSQHG